MIRIEVHIDADTTHNGDRMECGLHPLPLLTADSHPAELTAHMKWLGRWRGQRILATNTKPQAEIVTVSH